MTAASLHRGLDVRCFSGGAFQENGYLLTCRSTGRAAVVDPGYAAPAIVETLAREGRALDAIYLTHAHLDHVEGIPALRQISDAPIFLHPADRFLYARAAAQAASFGYVFTEPLPPVDAELVPGSPVSVGDVRLEVRFTPGHAPGHVIFYASEEGLALVGDVIFQRSIGRTDLPGGDGAQLIRSIREQVLTLPDSTRLLTGHGPETTVGAERRDNPFLIPHLRGGAHLNA
jgi:hydroxyacylglutathione hydrolase